MRQTDPEVDKLVDLMSSAGGSPNEQFKTALTAVLISPKFIYRVEIGRFAHGSQ